MPQEARGIVRRYDIFGTRRRYCGKTIAAAMGFLR
jgi:hypothetical protein